MARLKDRYQEQVIPALMKQFGYENRHQAPRLEKITLNVSMGEAIQNIKVLDGAVTELKAISGQKPVITRARKDISNFKLRKGVPIGCMVTLRRVRMYEFLDRLIHVALPQVRDFRGLSVRSFQGHGDYSLGIREQIIFPEIDVDSIEKVHGLTVSIVTTSISGTGGTRLDEGVWI